jgi:demethylmenaquinone methyltransferase/2-methoxy-6-polyprenyl-1,4-benzoquinol methylase
MSKIHREYFNALAPQWNSKVENKPVLKDYLYRFGISHGDKVLDVGAGTGRMTEHLCKLVGSAGLVAAIDIAELMLTEAKKNLNSQNVISICTDVCTLSLKNNQFDKVLCFSSFPHIKKPLEALLEINRILRPGGRLLILHTCSSQELNSFHASLKGIVSKDVLPTARNMVPLLKKSGLISKYIEDRNELYWVEAMKPE